MDLRILSQLVCPVSRAPFELYIIDQETESDGRKLVRTGILACAASKLWYPIINFVPLLLTFSTPIAQGFAKRYAADLAKIGIFASPDLQPMPGEKSVQKTFTEEWIGLGDDERTFLYTDDELVALHRDVWLQFSEAETRQVQSVLNVGSGYGKESIVLSRIFAAADIFAVDLNFSMIQAAAHLKAHVRVHPIIASLFHLPFAAASVDHVHSQGVIHHTYSTESAFRAIAAFVKPTGSLFIWVYAAEDSLVVPGFRGVLVRLYWLISHRIGRPILSRLPAPLRSAALFVLTAILHPLIKLRDRSAKNWKFQNTLHGLRDAFTPRFAHQHGFNELALWFEDAGFEPRFQSPRRYRELIGRRLIGAGFVGRRRDSAS